MYYKRITIIILLASIPLGASFRVNLLQPYDTLIRPPRNQYRAFDINLFAERGVQNAQGFSFNDDQENQPCVPCNQVNILQIWNSDQNGLAMLAGFNSKSPIGQKLIQVDANDDGTRGHFCVTGNLKLTDSFAASAYCHLWEYIYLAAYLPYYSMRLTDVCWRESTKNITEDDVRVKEYLTDNFFQNVCELGKLSLTGWDRSGIGDLAILIEFTRAFPQIRPLLKEVRTNIRAGLSLPTGVKEDEDIIFAVPFGYDGAVGILTAGGLDITLGYNLRCGFDVQVINLFGNTKDRRIKTEIDQTELLLLQKVRAYKDWGLVQRFNLYTELFNIHKGFSLLIGYQFFKQGDSTLSFCTCDFSTTTANTAHSLQEVTMHQAVIKASYDFSTHMSENAWAWPYISLYARIPFNGKNVAQIPVIGAILSLDF